MEQPRYIMLDGVRGYAALVVLFYHLRHFFGDLLPVANGYLAVDLFFVMSGFVIALTYERRLQSGDLRFRDFALRRFLRLYPVYLIGAGLGVFVTLVIAVTDGWFAQIWVLLPPMGAALMMMPELIWRGVDGPFPLNPPSWSLFFEFWGNLIYALWVIRLRNRAIAVLVGLALVAYVIASQVTGTVELGVSYAHLMPGLARFWFGFGLGVLICRLRGRISVPRGLRWPVLIAAMAFGALPDNDVVRFIWIAVVMPLGVVAALPITPVGWAGRACHVLGRLSYPLYLIHWPVMVLVTHFAVDAEGVAAWGDPVVGALIVIAALGLTAWVSARAEPRVQGWLRARIGSRFTAYR